MSSVFYSKYLAKTIPGCLPAFFPSMWILPSGSTHLRVVTHSTVRTGLKQLSGVFYFQKLRVICQKPVKVIIVSLPPTGAHHLAADFSSALRLVDTKLADHADQVWVIGGSSLYKELMESRGTKRLFVTRILKQFDSDTFLPEISPEKYRLLPEGYMETFTFHFPDNGISHSPAFAVPW
uniref:dihydrofolate reductase n=1 Tax=Nothobranchius furzeri TaxID=105023 RepID=A0A8C6MBS6_NOTFU